MPDLRTLLARWGLFLALAALPLTSCGGGGGGDEDSGPVEGSTPTTLSELFFQGNYRAVAQWCNTNATGSYAGPMNADGAALLRWAASTTLNDNTIVSAGNPGIDNFTVAPIGTLGWNEADPNGMQGGLITGGSVALAASNKSGANPEVRVAVQLGAAAYQQSLIWGSYFVAAWGSENPAAGTPSRRARWGTVVFDRFGDLGHASTEQNLNGDYSTDNFGGRNYTMTQDGSITFGMMQSDFTGGVHPSGELIIAGGGTSNGQFPTIAVLVQKSALQLEESFEGAFWIVGFEGTPTGCRSFHGTATADGVGTLSISNTTDNVDGVLGTTPATSWSYVIAPSGAMDVDGSRLFGHLSFSGRFAVLSGGRVDGQNPFFAFLAKK